MLTHSRPLFKEFRVVGQICFEDMDESDILPKAGYAMTVFHLLWISWLSGGAASPPVGAGQIPVGGPGGEASGSSSDPAVHS